MECHLVSFRVIQVNDGTNKPSPFRRALTFGLFSNNSRIFSMFVSVTEGRLILEFPLFLFKLVPKL